MYQLRSLVLCFTPLTSLFGVSSQRQAHRKDGGAASKLVESSISAQDRKRSAAAREMCDLDLKENPLRQQSSLTAQRQPFWIPYHHQHVWISPDLLKIHKCGICLPGDKMQGFFPWETKGWGTLNWPGQFPQNCTTIWLFLLWEFSPVAILPFKIINTTIPAVV